MKRCGLRPSYLDARKENLILQKQNVTVSAKRAKRRDSARSAREKRVKQKQEKAVQKVIKDDEKRIGSHSVSVLQGKQKVCYVSGQKTDLQKHHIFHGEGRREVSDRHGFWVYLQAKYHSAALGGLHAYPNSGLDLQLKRLCQREYEKVYGAEAFFEIFHEDFIPFKEEEAKDMQRTMWSVISITNSIRRINGERDEVYTQEDFWREIHPDDIKRPLHDCFLCEYESQFGEVEKCIHTKPDWKKIKTTEEAEKAAFYTWGNIGIEKRGFEVWEK